MTLSSEFLGKIVLVRSEKAKIGQPANAIYRDEQGDTHLITIEPEMGELLEGDSALLIAYKTEYYVARKIPALHGLF